MHDNSPVCTCASANHIDCLPSNDTVQFSFQVWPEGFKVVISFDIFGLRQAYKEFTLNCEITWNKSLEHTV